MGKRFDTLLFPGHKAKAFTLSYDDGVVQDKKLIEMFDRYGAKCTFNLNYGVLGYKNVIKGPDQKEVDISKFDKEEIKEIYKNHEVGGHGLYHSSLVSVGTPLAMYEIIEDKVNLEKLIDKLVARKIIPDANEFNKELEKGDIALEKAVELYSEGVKLTEVCRKQLDESKIKITEDNGTAPLN